jgi:phosphomevalonate kinase
MTGPATVCWHAPGKLFIAGEYAVMEPGHPAILAAVDRHVTATVSRADGADVEIDSDLCPADTRLRWRDGELAGLSEDDEKRAREDLSHAVGAIEVVAELLAERGLRPPRMRVSIRSGLHRNGTKFGLGSSGAVTVAAVTAVAAYCVVRLTLDERFRLAMLATARRSTGASGGDLAASVWGGWIAYQAPDRAAVLELAHRQGIEKTMRTPWPGFALRRLPPPSGLALEVGWTGEPVSTASLAGTLGTRQWRGTAAHQRFVERSDECVRAAIRAFETGDGPELLDRIRAARQLLARLGDEVPLGIFTPKLTALCDAAEAVGGAAKPSGAGGGDCGIALLDAAAGREIARLRQAWTAAGVLPLPIHIEPTNGSAE